MGRFLLLVLLTGCAPVTAIGEKIIGLTDPVLMGGVVLGVAPPEDEALRDALDDFGLDDLSIAQVVLADALELQDVENALVTDAQVAVRVDAATTAFEVSEDGWYLPAEGLSYTPGAVLEVEAQLTNRVNPGVVSVELPAAPELALDPVHAGGTPLVLDLSGQGFDLSFAALYDLEGNEVFTNLPESEADLLDFVLPGAEPVETVEIPGDVFENDTLYVLGVAGMHRAPYDAIDGFNEALTAVAAGQLALFPVSTGSPLSVNTVIVDTRLPDPPLDAWVESAGLTEGLSVDLFVADLLRAGEPVLDATVVANGAAVPSVAAGQYQNTSLPSAGTVDVRIQVPSHGEALVQAQVAAFPGADVPSAAANTPVEVGLPGGPWSAVLVTVVGPAGVVHTTVPTDPADWLTLLEEEAAVDSVTFPGLPSGTYALGIAPLESQPEGLSNVNGATSHVLAGSLGFVRLTVD